MQSLSQAGASPLPRVPQPPGAPSPMGQNLLIGPGQEGGWRQSSLLKLGRWPGPTKPARADCRAANSRAFQRCVCDHQPASGHTACSVPYPVEALKLGVTG